MNYSKYQHHNSGESSSLTNPVINEHLSDITVSVVICTIGRKSVYKTIDSLYKNTYTNFETILISQFVRLDIVLLSSYKRLHYFHLDNKGLSVARNFGTRLAKGVIICFTDDDCIIDKGWLINIVKLFQNHSDIIGIFGKSAPYRETKNQRKICPCIFETRITRVIKKPCYHSQYIGFGNNMAFLKKAFLQYGYFKEWLGINSIGLSAEDAEFALRLLVRKEKLLSTEKAIIYHNHWLTLQEWDRQSNMYVCGELSCYGYFAFSGHKFAKKVVIRNLKDSYYGFINIIKQIIKPRRTGILDIYRYIHRELYKIWGIFVGYYFSHTEKI